MPRAPAIPRDSSADEPIVHKPPPRAPVRARLRHCARSPPYGEHAAAGRKGNKKVSNAPTQCPSQTTSNNTTWVLPQQTPEEMPRKARAGLGSGASLPTKERALFTRLIQEYEGKKYKLGLKTADAILKKHPEHGETLCMKGLIVATTGDRQAGLELARQGVRRDLTSFISWHALGILNRMDKNYDEAIKCYAQALRIEGGTNINLIRESGYMHMQSRNYRPLIDGRITLLRIQPHIRSNWAGLAAAYHLSGDLQQAEKVLAHWESSCRDVPERNYEHSEMLLYRATILFEAKRYNETIAYLSDALVKIVDKRAARTLIAKALLELRELDKAEPTWRALVAENQEDRDFVAGWVQSKDAKLAPTTAEGSDKTASVLRELQQLYPHSQTAKRMELAYAAGPQFAEALENYLARALTKGVPSIFADLKALLSDEAKRRTIECIALALLHKYSPSISPNEPPSSYLWTLYFIAQYYSHTGAANVALSYIDSAIAHTPTLPELHMTRARILKRAGALEAASLGMEDARLLDGQDRFLNSKDAKYKLRVGEFEEAERVMGLFTKPDAVSPLFDLLEMQALWFILKEGLCYQSHRQLNLALKRYSQTKKIFEDHWDDQLDFHSYCIRKFTLRDYADMCRWEDGIRGHRFYIEACLGMIDIYLATHDDPSSMSQRHALVGVEANGNGLSEAQKKEAKRLKKAELKKKEEEKKQAAAATAAAAAAAKKQSSTEDEEINAPPSDTDPEGWGLLQRQDPLAEVGRLLRILHLHAASEPRVWLSTFEYALRDNNWLLCARALRKATDLLGGLSSSSYNGPALSGRLHVARLQLFKRMPDLASAPEAVRAGIEAALGTSQDLQPPDGVHIDRLNDDFFQRTADAVSYSRAKLALGGAAEDEAAKFVLLQVPVTPGAKLSTLLEAYRLLAGQSLMAPKFQTPASAQQLEEYRSKAHALVPLAEEFMTKQQRAQARETRIQQRRDWEPKPDSRDGTPAVAGQV